MRIVGTPDYIAPEILNGVSISNPSIDWWSFGVIIYEFIVGIPPFNDDTVDQIFERIKNRDLEWPDIGYEEDMMTPEAYDFINRLLDLDHNTRLGANGVEEIKAHPFFKGFSWEKIRSIKAPIEPKVVKLDESLGPSQKEKNARDSLQKLLANEDESSRAKNEKLKSEIAKLTRLDLLVEKNMEEHQNALKRQSTKILDSKNKVTMLEKLCSEILTPFEDEIESEFENMEEFEN